MTIQRKNTDVTAVRIIRKTTAITRLSAAGAAIVLLLCGVAAGADDVATDAPTTAPTSQPAATSQPSAARATFVTDGLGADGMLHLLSGKGAVLTTRTPYKRVSVGDPAIADFNAIGPSTVLVTAKKAGGTQLILWDDMDRSQVVDVVVDLDLAAAKRQIKAAFPDLDIDVSALSDTIALRGHVPTMQVAEQAVELTSSFAKVHNFLEISGGQQVMLQVQLAEVDKSVERDLGVNFGGTDGVSIFGNNAGAFFPFDASGNPLALVPPSAGGLPGTVFGQGKVGSVTFAYFIKALRENGLVRSLAEPNLITTSGQDATFLAGGEFPVPVPQSGSGGAGVTTVEFHEFGVRLHFIPQVLGGGRIRLKVAPEVSDLDFADGTIINGGRVPAFTKRNVNTTVELGDGQTFALAGLLNNKLNITVDTIPLLGDIPVLGALFKSTKYQRSETELVIIVTPRLVAPMNPDQVSLLPGQHWRYPDPVSIYFGTDLGGPEIEPSQADADKKRGGPPPQFHGTYGYTTAGAGGATTVSH